MKFNKQIAIILVLLSLLLSAISAVFYLYKQNQKVVVNNEQLRVVYVASKDIKKDTKIKKEDIAQLKIAKKYVLTTPLLLNEIIGKFAKENIYKHEVFRKEKISIKIESVKQDIIKYKNNSYNIKFSLFSNPNYSLNIGEFINIVSVYPKSLKKDNLDYNVQYVAKNIEVIGFLEKGKFVKQCFRSAKQKKRKKKKTDKDEYEIVTLYADEIVLDISSATIIEVIDDYNKGKQLWMVKTKKGTKLNEKILENIKTEVKIAKVKKIKKVKRYKKRSYPVKWYMPQDIKKIKRATIRYADTNEVSQSTKTTVKTDTVSQCKSMNNILIGVSRNVDLRKQPSVRSKLIKRLHKNYLINYDKKVNPDWYKICDGSYVHKNEAKEISLKQAQKKLKNGTKTKK